MRREIARLKIDGKTLEKLRKLSDEYRQVQELFHNVSSELARLIGAQRKLESDLITLERDMRVRSSEMQELLRVIAASNGVDPDAYMSLDVDRGELIVDEADTPDELKPTEKTDRKK